MPKIDPKNSADKTGTKITSVIGKKIKKYFYYSIALFILMTGMYVYWSFFYTYSDGYRAGMLQKFSRKGNIFKTYEGEMILSSVQSNKNVAIASEKFLFSVANTDIALQLEKLQGKNVVVHYTEKNNTLPWRGETVFIVSSVKLSD
ncbi:MAG: hypothetical protein WCI92_13760 [Bacteroidota bacterium]